MTDIFISYAREDGEAARWIARRASEVGYSVWWDRTMLPGADIYRVIEQQIHAANRVIVIWSRHSVGSRWVRDEADLAAKQNKLIPLCIDASEPPLGFRAYNIMYMEDWDNDFKRILHAMNPQAVKYTTVHLMQEGYSNPDQVKSLLRGLDADLIAQTFNYMRERGYTQWVKSGPQRQAVGRLIANAFANLFSGAGAGNGGRPTLQADRRTALAGPGAPRGQTQYGANRTPRTSRVVRKPAPFARRLMAGIIDFSIVAAVVVPMLATLGSHSVFVDGAVFMLAWCGYLTLLLSNLSRGRTVGYIVADIQLVDERLGRPPPPQTAFLLSVTSLFPLSWIWSFFDRKNRMLHNITTDTLVVMGGR